MGVGGAPACVTVAIGPRVVADDPRRTGKVGPFYGAQCFTKARVQPWWARTLSRFARAALGRGRRAAVFVCVCAWYRRAACAECGAAAPIQQRDFGGRAIDWALAARRREQGTAPGRGWPAAPRCRGLAAVCVVFPDMAAVLQRRAWVVARLPGCGSAVWGAAQLLGVAACFFGWWGGRWGSACVRDGVHRAAGGCR